MLLSLRNITKSFGAVQALKDVSLAVAEGEVRAICGENGAGKSTLLKILMGIYRRDGGSIQLDGVEVAIDSSQAAQELGIALVAQELSLAPHLSVLDNIWLGNRNVPFFHRRREFRTRAAEAPDLLGVDIDLDRPVASLTMGERQIVEIARLLTKNARVLILDEPTATLSDIEIEHMMATLRKLKSAGKSILYVTHRLGEVFEICDSVTVMRNGRDVAHESIGNIDRDTLVEQMLGRAFEDMYPSHTPSNTVAGQYAIRHLTVPGTVDDFSLTVPRGRIVGLAGQIGSGTESILRARAGLNPYATGTVEVDGTPVPLGSVAARVAENITYISEDRAGEGIFERNVLENIVASRLSDHAKFGVLNWGSLRRTATSLCAALNVDAVRLGANAFDLSGGNQQKLLFGRALGGDRPGVLLLCEPTRGVDVGARAEIYKLLREFCDKGYAVFFTSTDLEEIVGISDTVVTMFRGNVVSVYHGDAINASVILSDIIHPTQHARRATV